MIWRLGILEVCLVFGADLTLSKDAKTTSKSSLECAHFNGWRGLDEKFNCDAAKESIIIVLTSKFARD